MQIIIVLDGVAEDYKDLEETSLDLANKVALDQFTQNSLCGLFNPIDEQLDTVKTDLVLANLLGIRPKQWPSRSYFEALLYSHTSISASCFVRFRTQLPIENLQELLDENERVIVSLADKFGFRVTRRLYERNLTSYLVWIEENEDVKAFTILNREKQFSYKLNLFKEDVDEALQSGSVYFDEMYYGHEIEQKEVKAESSLLVNARGSLVGLFRRSGFDVLVNEGNPLDFENTRSSIRLLRDQLKIKARNLLVVLYFKAPDWASHFGDRSLKITCIEHIDKILLELFVAWENDIEKLLIISDHRTNIGSQTASRSPSIFVLFNRDNKVTGVNSFTEKKIEKFSRVLSMLELHELFFTNE